MKRQRRLVTHSDSGFNKEQEKGYGIRAANHVRAGISLADNQNVYHFMQAERRGHRRMTRSTFSSELQAAVDACDELLALQLALSELVNGAVSAEETRRQYDQETLARSPQRAFSTELVVDAKSLYSALSAVIVREPAEKSCGVLLFWLREQLDRRALDIFTWCDT